MSKRIIESDDEDDCRIISKTSIQEKKQKTIANNMQSQPESAIVAELKAITNDKESWVMRYEEKMEQLSVLKYRFKLLEEDYDSLNIKYKKLASKNDSLIAENARQIKDYNILEGNKTLQEEQSKKEMEIARKDWEKKENSLKEQIAKLNSNTVQCLTCLSTLSELKENGINIVVTKCGHLFCADCIFNWWEVENKRTCPSGCGAKRANPTVMYL
jgi:hypothetical protein